MSSRGFLLDCPGLFGARPRDTHGWGPSISSQPQVSPRGWEDATVNPVVGRSMNSPSAAGMPDPASRHSQLLLWSLARPAKRVLWSESGRQTLELRAKKAQPWLPLPWCVWLGDKWDLPKATRHRGGQDSNTVHFGFKLRALSSSPTVGRREQSERDLMFPRGETEAKADGSF